MRIFTTGLLVLSASLLLAAQSAPPAKTTVVESVSITSDSSVSSQHLQEITQELLKHTYRRDAETEIAERANYELLKDGYFKAETTTAEVQVVNDTPAQRTVSVTLRINEGQQYRLKQIVFKNNQVYPAPQLRKAFDIADGDVFNADKIRVGMEKLRELYAEKGYINFTPIPQPILNDQAHAIDLVLALDEGAQYKVGSLILKGRAEWPPDQAEKLLAIWRPYSEQPYRGKLGEQIQQAMEEMFPGLTPDQALPAIRQHPERRTLDIEVSLPSTVAKN